MDKDRYELKGKSFIDNKTNQCLNFGLKDLVRVIATLNSMDRWLEQDKETIADLEAKLVEKDLRIEELESQYAYECECNKQFVECQQENEQLKQQLAEKDEEIKDLVDWGYNERKNAYNWEKDYYQANQDKISFAVEQLEKVKELINNKLEFMWQNNAEMTCRDRHIIEKSYEDIDELITEIKEGK